jgi:ankyrin repeat protein
MDEIVIFLKENYQNMLKDYISKDELFKQLIKQNLNVELRTEAEAEHALCSDEIYECIFESNNLDNLRYLLDSGININSTTFNDYGSILQIALSRKIVTFQELKLQIDIIISYGFDINNFITGDGYEHEYPTLLFYVCTYSNNLSDNLETWIDVVRYLILLGVNPNITNIDGNTVLHQMIGGKKTMELAMKLYGDEIFTIQNLRDANFNIKEQHTLETLDISNKFDTCVQKEITEINNLQSMIKFLFTCVDNTIKNNDGYTPLDFLLNVDIINIKKYIIDKTTRLCDANVLKHEYYRYNLNKSKTINLPTATAISDIQIATAVSAIPERGESIYTSRNMSAYGSVYESMYM